jgi:hypothetical protein
LWCGLAALSFVRCVLDPTQIIRTANLPIIIISSHQQIVQNQHTKPFDDPTKDGGEGEGPGQVVVFTRDAATGALTPTGQTADVPSNVSVCVVELP